MKIFLGSRKGDLLGYDGDFSEDSLSVYDDCG